MRIYLAGELFSIREHIFNRKLKEALEERIPDLVLDLPQDSSPADGFTEKESYQRIFNSCRIGVEKADLVLALYEGADVDSGVAWEAGYARGLGKLVIAIRTDFREQQYLGVNLMLSLSADKFISATPETSVEELAEKITVAIKEILES